MSTQANSTIQLGLDPRDVALTQQPVERATMLPPAAFADPSVLEWELDQHLPRLGLRRPRLRRRRAGQVPDPRARHRQRLRRSAAEDGTPRAFLNVCRHRGARIVEEPEGQVRKRLRCPYHAWSYDLDGELRAAPHMDGVEDFDRSCNGLLEVRLAVVGGLVLIDLSGEAPDPTTTSASCSSTSIATALDRARAAAGETTYEVAANWKGIAENYNECLHCPGVHPELNALSHYMSGEEVTGDGAWCGGSMTLSEDAATMALEDGRPQRRPAADRRASPTSSRHGPLLRPVPERARLAASRLRDAAHPLAARRRPHRVTCEWFFEPRDDGRATTSTPATRSTSGTRSTSRTGTSASLTQKGVRTRGYTAGRYSAEEFDVHAFDLMVADRYMEALRTRARWRGAPGAAAAEGAEAGLRRPLALADYERRLGEHRVAVVEHQPAPGSGPARARRCRRR